MKSLFFQDLLINKKDSIWLIVFVVQIWRLILGRLEWRILKYLLTFEDTVLVIDLYFYDLATGNRSHSGELSTACRSGILKQISKSKWNTLSRHHSGEFFILLRSVDLEKDSIWWIVSMVQIWRLISKRFRVKNINWLLKISFWWIIYFYDLGTGKRCLVIKNMI